MFSSQHDLLCSLLKCVLTTTHDPTNFHTELMSDLCVRLTKCIEEWRLVNPHDRSRGDACIESIRKHNLLPLHIEYINAKIARQEPIEDSTFCFFAGYLVYISLDLIKGSHGESSERSLQDYLVDLDYLPFLAVASQACQLNAGQTDAEVNWTVHVCILRGLYTALSAVDRDLVRQQLRQSRSMLSVPRGLGKNGALKSKKMLDFLLWHLSLAVRQVLPPDECLPGALASFSRGGAGMLQCRYHLFSNF
jgi:hypothetical protein